MRVQVKRRLIIPEVVQTSAMDCGPASLKCLLEGFGIPVSLLSRGWIVVGLTGLIPLLVTGSGEPVAVAVALGGIVLASRALQTLASSLAALTGAAVAWRKVAPLFHAGARRVTRSAPDALLAVSGDPSGEAGPVVEAHDLTFRYHPQGEPVLRGCSMTIHTGDKLLLEGPSGGGKSTLAALLVGLRQPESGLLLVRGLDRHTLGEQEWRRQITAAPQFHENHVMTGTFMFNLLMGRRWPPLPEDVAEAETLCAELGLGSLLSRMPGGLLQVVGETGWRLSHGEQSRLFIARALLQGADLVVLDESFAALDPQSLSQALQCVLRRAPTLMVIAHP